MQGPLIVIVKFDLEPGEIDTLFPVIQQFFREEVSLVDGFISAKFHRNEDGSVLINYATWASAAHFKKFISEVAMVSATSKKIQQYRSHADLVYEMPL